MAIVIAMGMPAIYRALRQEGIRKACADLMEGCTQARAQAILQGVPTDLVIRSEDGQLSVQSAPEPARRPRNELTINLADGTSHYGQPQRTAFSGRLPDNVGVQMLDVNFRDHMEFEEARVRFYPNGTSDEFTIVLRSEEGEIRKISLEVVTGLPTMEVLR